MFQTKVVEKSRIYIVCTITCFWKSCRLWDNVEKYGRTGQATDDNIILRMCFVCWITKATNTHSEYVVPIAFPLQQWFHERAPLLRYTYIVCPFLFLCVIFLSVFLLCPHAFSVYAVLFDRFNKTGNGVHPDTMHSLNQYLLYCGNVVRFDGTHVNVIWFTPKEEYGFLYVDFMKLINA